MARPSLSQSPTSNGSDALNRLDRVKGGTSAAQDSVISRFYPALGYFLISITLGMVFRDLRAGWLALVVAVNFLLFLTAWRAMFGQRLSYVDPGIIFLAVVAVYSMLPLLTTEAMNFNFGVLQDARLARIALDDGIISTTIANANAIMAGFGATYLLIRAPRMPVLELPGPHVMVTLWLMFGLAFMVQVGLRLAGGGGGNYGDEYLLIQSLPVFVIQIFNILNNLFYVSLFGLLIYYFTARKLSALAILLVMSFFLFLVVTSARTPLVLIAFSVIVCWDHLYKRISPLVIFLLFVLIIGTFLILGSLRGGTTSLSGVFAQSEFMAVFVTALDIRQIYLAGSSLDMSGTLLLGDLLRLVPQQILPFEKVDPASWYVTTFYPEYAAQGGGFAFGMLAEAALSGGFIPALIRGLALGAVLSVVLNTLTKRHSIWTYIIYVWVAISVYQSFRDTTFTLFGRFFFQLAPAILLCVLLSSLLRRGDREISPPVQPAPGDH